jgi:Domain of unknown function (DUF4234)
MTEPTDATAPDPNAPPPFDPSQAPPPPPGAAQPYGYGQPPPPAGYAQPPVGWGQGPGPGPIGKVRGTGVSILLYIITFGIYGWFWYYGVHDEMKRHRNGDGLGGGIALILAVFVSIVMPFITADEVGKMYEARGQAKPVSAMTGLWAFPGIFLLGIGPIVWFVKTNGALNDYWKSLGATG